MTVLEEKKTQQPTESFDGRARARTAAGALPAAPRWSDTVCTHMPQLAMLGKKKTSVHADSPLLKRDEETCPAALASTPPAQGAAAGPAVNA